MGICGGWESACKPGSVEDSHSSGMCVAAHLEQPTREQRGPRIVPLFGLAPGGVCPATPVARRAVRSYRTISPLLRPQPGRYIFCGTFRRLAPPRRYLAPCPMEPGLSSTTRRRQRLSGRLPGLTLGGIRLQGKPDRSDARHRPLGWTGLWNRLPLMVVAGTQRTGTPPSCRTVPLLADTDAPCQAIVNLALTP